MAYEDFKDLAKKKKNGSDKVLSDKVLLPKTLNMMGIKEVMLPWFTNLLTKSRKVVVIISM